MIGSKNKVQGLHWKATTILLMLKKKNYQNWLKMADFMDDIRRLLKNLKSSIFGIFNFALDLSEANFFGEILILSKKSRFLVVPQTETLARKKKISKIGPFLVKLCVVLLSTTFFWYTLYIYAYTHTYISSI